MTAIAMGYTTAQENPRLKIETWGTQIPGGTDAAAALKHHKLVDAAQQFEAMFLAEMLKPMNGSGGIDGQEGDGGSGQGGTLQQFGTEAMAKAIASAGGMGIARHVVAEVEQRQAKRESKKNLQTELKS
jgi:Rod binding domain-containing protein